jgi:hypothetical protein
VNSTDPSVRKIIEIKRDEIKLKEQEAKAEIVERFAAGWQHAAARLDRPSFFLR